jgi:hypothetical protein
MSSRNFNSENNNFNNINSINNSNINVNNVVNGDTNNNLCKISYSTRNLKIKIGKMLMPSFAVGSIFIVTISNYLKVSDSFLFKESMILGVLLIVAIFLSELKRKRFKWLGFFGLRLNKEDVLQLLNMKGICPVCKSEMKFRNMDKDDLSRIYGQCSRFPKDHSYNVDPTYLDDIG